jgi:hypothetical protein
VQILAYNGVMIFVPTFRFRVTTLSQPLALTSTMVYTPALVKACPPTIKLVLGQIVGFNDIELG